MKDFERFIIWINSEGEIPQEYGKLHILFSIGVIALAILLSVRFRNAGDKTFRTLIGVMFAVMLLGEVGKQVFSNMSVVEGEIKYTYNWSNLPFQLCSTPIYVMPFLSFMPNSRIRDFAASYIMTVGLTGGIAVYLVPKTVFSAKTFLNIQTMIHHGIQVVAGVFTAVYYRRRINCRFYFDGLAVFAILFLIANLLNTVGYDMLLANGILAEGDEFNMFYISPHTEQSIPVFSDVFELQYS